MADTSDVEACLVSAIAAAVYPNGTGAASALLNAAPCKVFRGWPVDANLRDDLAAGIASVSVYPRNGVERNRTAYPREPVKASAATKTITVAVSGARITIGGTVSTPQTILILANHVAVHYAVQPADTLTSVATGVATALAGPFPGTTNVGAVVTVAGQPGELTVRVVTTTSQATEIRRVDKQYQISLWAPTPELRDSLAGVVDPALTRPIFLLLPDGGHGWVRYDSTLLFDTAEEEGLYRRDLFYAVEYAMLDLTTDYEVGAVVMNAAGGPDTGSATPNPPTPSVTTVG